MHRTIHCKNPRCSSDAHDKIYPRLHSKHKSWLGIVKAKSKLACMHECDLHVTRTRDEVEARGRTVRHTPAIIGMSQNNIAFDLRTCFSFKWVQGDTNLVTVTTPDTHTRHQFRKLHLLPKKTLPHACMCNLCVCACVAVCVCVHRDAPTNHSHPR
jgi:hypothetical protein